MKLRIHGNLLLHLPFYVAYRLTLEVYGLTQSTSRPAGKKSHIIV